MSRSTRWLVGLVSCQFVLAGCTLGSGNDCTDEKRAGTLHVFVVDRATRKPLCDAAVSVVDAEGKRTPLAPAPADADVPCGYLAAGHGEDSGGTTTLTFTTSRDGYQTTLTIVARPTSARACQDGDVEQTIEMDKLL